MRTKFCLSFFFLTHTALATAQTPVRLSVDQAVQMALDRNVDLAADRLDPQISDAVVAAAAAVYRPSLTSALQQNNQVLPPTNFLFPIATSTNVFTSSAGLTQRLSRFGTSYSVGWSATHTTSNSVLNSYNPLLQSGLAFNLSQPLVRDLSIDVNRLQLTTSRVNRDIADTHLRESVVRTTSAVKTAYWSLASVVAAVEARQSTLALAQELVRVNKTKVDVGTAPPLDLLSAQAEETTFQEQLIVAETAVKQAEDRLRLLIYDASDPTVWNTRLELVDAPPTMTITPDVDAAVAAALQGRADLVRAKKEIDNAQTSVTFTKNQRLPDVRVNASYLASGLGGTEVVRSGGFPGTVLGAGNAVAFGSVLNQLVLNRYPTWAAGVSVSYPVGNSVEDANYVRARIEREQSEVRLKAAQARVIQQVRSAARQIEMNGKRIETTRAVRELAEQRLDAERQRFDVGMSTNFLVIQAQRDLAEARTNELAAVLAYDLALVSFDAIQQAGPADQLTPESPAAPGGFTTTSGSSGVPTSGSTFTTATTGGISIPGVGQR